MFNKNDYQSFKKTLCIFFLFKCFIIELYIKDKNIGLILGLTKCMLHLNLCNLILEIFSSQVHTGVIRETFLNAMIADEFKCDIFYLCNGTYHTCVKSLPNNINILIFTRIAAITNLLLCVQCTVSLYSFKLHIYYFVKHQIS